MNGTRRSIVAHAAVLGFLLAASLAASANEAPAPPDPLQRLGRLVGPDWVAEFPDGGLRDTQRFEWMVDRKFLRNTHEVTNAEGRVVYSGETVYGVDRETGSLLWWYFNSTGGHVTGDITVDGNRMTISGVNHGGGDQTSRVRGEFEIGDGSWTSTSYFWTDGAWEKRFTMHFRPAGDPPGGD